MIATQRKSYVYVLTDKHNGKLYVGKANDPQSRFKSHKRNAKEFAKNEKHLTHFQNALNGRPEAFSMSVIMEHSSEEEAYGQERNLITEYRQQGKELYNLNDGGEGQLNPTKETRFKIGTNYRGKKLTASHRDAISDGTSGKNNPMFGRKQSPESNAKNAESNREYQKVHGNAMHGRKHTPEAIESMREKAKKRRHTPETRVKMAESHRHRAAKKRPETENK